MDKYTITILVDDPDVDRKKLSWLLSEAGEVISIAKEVNDPSYEED